MGSVEVLGIHDHPIQNLSILKAFPNIKAIEFFHMGRDSLHSILSATTEEHLEGRVIPTLSRFECDYEDLTGIMTPEDIRRKLHRVTPNLTKLKLWLGNESFRAVCECWPRLEELVIVGNQVDDEGITGIVAAGADERNPHNITNLQGLKSFTMTHYDEEYEDDAGFAPITHKSVAEVLMLPALEKVQISLNATLDVDVDVILTMENKFKNCKITWVTRRQQQQRHNENDAEDLPDNDEEEENGDSESDGEDDDPADIEEDEEN